MGYIINSKLVDKITGNLVGVMISCGGTYLVPVTIEKAKELNVQDIDIVNYLDVQETEIIVAGTKFGMVEYATRYYSDYCDSPVDYINDDKIYYGYYFEPRRLLYFNSDLALERLNGERKGTYLDE